MLKTFYASGLLCRFDRYDHAFTGNHREMIMFELLEFRTVRTPVVYFSLQWISFPFHLLLFSFPSVPNFFLSKLLKPSSFFSNVANCHRQMFCLWQLISIGPTQPYGRRADLSARLPYRSKTVTLQSHITYFYTCRYEFSVAGSDRVRKLPSLQ